MNLDSSPPAILNPGLCVCVFPLTPRFRTMTFEKRNLGLRQQMGTTLPAVARMLCAWSCPLSFVGAHRRYSCAMRVACSEQHLCVASKLTLPPSNFPQCAYHTVAANGRCTWHLTGVCLSRLSPNRSFRIPFLRLENILSVAYQTPTLRNRSITVRICLSLQMRAKGPSLSPLMTMVESSLLLGAY